MTAAVYSPPTPLALARRSYDEQGFLIAPRLLPDEAVERANVQIDRLIGGDYVTGVAPLSGHEPVKNGAEPALIKIDQPQLSDPSINEIVAHSEIGRWAAALTGASMIQVWAVQLLQKRPGGAQSGNVGWHQDDDYWSKWWEGEVFTCWLALSDVPKEAGAMSFVPGSHTWGFLGSGDFFDTDLDGKRAGIPIPPGQSWDEVPSLLPPGSASFHHKRTVHGSGPNVSTWARRSYAIHLRTERSQPLANCPEYYVDHLDNPLVCPVAYAV